MNNSQVVEFENVKIDEQICIEKYFYESIHISLFDKYFQRNKKSKLCFGDRVAVLNVNYFEYGGSTNFKWLQLKYKLHMIGTKS